MGIITKARVSVKPGDRFGRWVVLGVPFRIQVGRAKVSQCVALCDCGSVAVVGRQKLSEGRSRSCGCLRNEATSRRSTKHGDSRNAIYRRWVAMNHRCYHKKTRLWSSYGGRGIAVCKEWHDYKNFKKWAEASGFREDLSLERKDNDGDYSPGNCCWETKKRQSRNMQKTIYLDAFGERKPMLDWAEDSRCAVNKYTLRNRIQHGWDHEKAITSPAVGKR